LAQIEACQSVFLELPSTFCSLNSCLKRLLLSTLTHVGMKVDRPLILTRSTQKDKGTKIRTQCVSSFSSIAYSILAAAF